MSPANRITGFYHWTNDYELRGASKFIPRESMEEKDNPVWMAKGEWQTVRGNALVASVQYRALGLRRHILGSCAGKGVDHRHRHPDNRRQLLGRHRAGP